MNEISLGEAFYIRARQSSLGLAERFLTRLEMLPIEVVSNTFGEVMDASRLKAQYPISYADAFVVATAMRMNAVIITGDPEFKAVEHLAPVHWLRRGHS